MNIVSISGLFLGVTCLSLGVLILRYQRNYTHLTFAVQNLCISIWGFGFGVGTIVKSPETALIWWKVGHVGAFFLAVLLLHHVILLNKLSQKLLLLILYVWAALFPILCLFNIEGMKMRYMFNQYFFPEIKSPIYLIYGIVWIAIGAYVTILIIRAYIMTPEHEKTAMRLYSLAYLAGLWGGGTFVFLALFNINIFYPYGNFLIPVYCGLITYTILRHKLFDIEVIIKKALVFTVLFTVIFSIFVGVAFLIQQFIGAGNNLVGFAVSSLIIILAVRPLEDILTKLTDKYLFQKKYDYKQILKSFIDEVITVLSLDTIVKSTLDLLDKALHPQVAAILLLNRLEDKYTLFQSLGLSKDITWDNKSIIPSFLKTTKDILSVEKSGDSAKIPDEVREEMGSYEAKIAIPLMLHNDMIGIMLLGKKKSDEEYTKDDMDILTDLARTESVAIGNAQLFAETAQNERRAAIGTLAAGINHEIGNPLNIINTKMQVYLMSIERGLYKDKTPEEIIAEARSIMNTCLQQTMRISDITKKLSSFAKPSKDFKPELTDIEEQIDDTLAVVGHDLELERVEIKKKIQKPLSKILGDKRQIQQVLFNIIRNAGQAIKEKGVIEISAYDAADGTVKIDVSDTGHGIPEDKLDKIYEPFFTTKEPGKGTGLGLSIVRQLVWRNKGDIKVKSRVGEGTTFTITFPSANKGT